jgi:hypothetical protein
MAGSNLSNELFGQGELDSVSEHGLAASSGKVDEFLSG